MPVIKSAIKRARQSEKHRERNAAFKRELKAAVKNVATAVEQKDKQGLDDKLKRAQSLLDKAAKRNIYHPNKSARKKAQLARAVASLAPKTVQSQKKTTPKSKKSTQKSTAKTTKPKKSSQ